MALPSRASSDEVASAAPSRSSVWAGHRRLICTRDSPAHSSSSNESSGQIPHGGPTMIDEELRAILACPACKGELIFEENRIICPECKKAYPLRTGIPVMLLNK